MHNPPIFIVNYGAHYSLGGCANAGFSDLNQLVFEYVCSNFFQIFVNQTTFNYFHLFIIPSLAFFVYNSPADLQTECMEELTQGVTSSSSSDLDVQGCRHAISRQMK